MSIKRKVDDGYANSDSDIDTEIDEPRTPIREPRTHSTPSTGATIPEDNASPSTHDYWTNLLKNAEMQRKETEARQAEARADKARGIYTPATVYAGKLTGRIICELKDGFLVPLTREKLLARNKQYYYEDGEPIPKSDITGNLGDDMIAERGGNIKRTKRSKSNKRRSKRRKSNKRRTNKKK